MNDEKQNMNESKQINMNKIGIIPADGLIAMDNVSFTTPLGVPVASNLSFKIKEGGMFNKQT